MSIKKQEKARRLEKIQRRQAITELILRAALALDTTPEEITSNSRADKLVLTRHAIAHIARQRGNSLLTIATALHRHQSGTILNSCKRSAELLNNNKHFRSLYNYIINTSNE
jgi:chromosomal replication initiation ATPase DnaA